MKKILFFLLMANIGSSIKAQQNVGIGTNTPNASAMLDITSPFNNKGLLIPRMTSSQRDLIPSPAPGLMVYETSTNSFWYYNSSVWNQIGTGGASPWTTSGTNIYNSNTGNVGIGTSSPTSKLHIAGNSLLINGTNPIFQFQQAGVNTGYVQVSSDDLRIGTNSGNGSGKMVIRMDGNDRIFIDSIGQMGIGKSIPTEKLDVAGKIRIISDGGISSQPGLIIYPNPDNAFDPYGPSNISFYNWASDGNGGNNYTSKYQIRFEGGVSEKLKLQHVDYDNQLVLRSNGNVGVNVSSPTEKLHISGNLLVQEVAPLLKLKSTSIVAASAEPGIEFNGPSSNLAKIQYTNSSLVLTGRSGGFNDLVLNNGNVGINYATPAEKLHVLGNMILAFANPILQLQQGNIDKGFIQLNGDDFRVGTNTSNINGKFVVRTAAGDQFFVDNAGYVGIGVSGLGAEARVHVGTGLDASLVSNGYLMLGNSSGSNLIFDNNEIMARSAGAAGNLVLQNDGGTVRIGNVAVPSGYKFAVNGKVICEEVRVKLSTAWPDYVFSDNHQLRSLPELKQFIQTNKHLPGIPSAKEVETNGIAVGEMQKKMMEKIEELTLYIIQQQKEIEQLKIKIR